MLKNEILKEVAVRLKKGTVLPIDGDKVKYNELFNWSEDTHVLDTVDYVLLDYNLIDSKGNIIEVDTIETTGNASITEFKENNDIVITDSNGDKIEGYKLLGNIYDNTMLTIRGADERHSEENNYRGSTLDLYVNTDILTKYFEII